MKTRIAAARKLNTFALVALVALAAASPRSAAHWTQISSGTPPTRGYHAMVYDSARARLVLFGGATSNSGSPVSYRDTWERIGTIWTLAANNTGPSARLEHTMAYDSVRGRTVLFGGQTVAGVMLGDTWEWNGLAASWTQVSSTGPRSRTGAAMVFDASRARTVLFGGFGGGSYLGDTWEWTGSNWIHRADTGPAPRSDAAIAYDPVRQRIVLFGGASGPGYLGDTWEFDGVAGAWTQLSGTGPAPRFGAASTFDPVANRVVLFGGFNGANLGDTWEWNGVTAAWTQVASIGPSPRYNHALVFDVSRGATVLYGGFPDGGPTRDDTWEFAPAATPSCGSRPLTQSTNPALIGPDSVWCGDTTSSAETSLARAFVAPFNLEFRCVTFGVLDNTGGPVNVRVRVLRGDVHAAYGSLVSLAETQVLVPAATHAHSFTAAFNGLAIASGTPLVVELISPSRLPADGGDNSLLSFGCNSQGESAPSYTRAPACSVPNFVTLTEVGFGNRDLVMTLGAEPAPCSTPPGAPPNNCPLNATPLADGHALAFTTVGASSSGPAGSCASSCCIGGTGNDGVDVWYRFQAGPETRVTLSVLVENGLNPAIALYDLGTSAAFEPADLGGLLVSCANAGPPGEETADFNVTPGNFYLVQVGTGGGGGGGGSGGRGYVGRWDGPVNERSVLTCVPCRAGSCVNLPFNEYFALSQRPNVSEPAETCSSCTGLPCPPCLDNIANLVTYWPLDDPSSGFSYSTKDAVGSADLFLPVGFCGTPPTNYCATYSSVAGVRGNGIAMLQGNAQTLGNTFPSVGLSSFTVSAWVVRPAAGQACNVIGASSQNGQTYWSITINSDGTITFADHSACATLAATESVTTPNTPPTSLVPVSMWTHIAVVVSKGSSPAGCGHQGYVAFYMNGILFNIQPLNNTYYNLGGTFAQVGAPGLWLDEIMVFDAPLNPGRIQQLYDTAATGPCNLAVWQTPYVDCAVTHAASLVICNIFGPDDQFGVTFTPDTASPSCGPGVTAVGSPPIPPCPSGVFIAGHSCSTFPLALTIPPCVTNTVGSSWFARVDSCLTPNPSSARTVHSTALCQYVTANPGNPPFAGIRRFQSDILSFDTANVSGSPVAADYRLSVLNADGTTDAALFSLNHQPSGQPVTGALNLAVGQHAPITVTVETQSVDALAFYTLVLSVDLNRTGNFVPAGALGLRAQPPSIRPCLADVNTDGVVNVADYLGFLQRYSTGHPRADLNGDGQVNIADYLTFLSLFAAGC
jgi:hypothetical protein